MENPIILGLFCTAAGVFSFSLAYKFKTDDAFAKKYIETSPKAFIWRKMLGVEKATALTHKVFIPLGFVMSTVLVLIGLFCLISNFI